MRSKIAGEMNMDMVRRVLDFIKQNKMLESGDRVVVALSGGADSVCLLSVLRELPLDLKLRAVHVHHGIRGEEADRDADFVRKLCEAWRVPLEIVYRKAADYAAEWGLSEEEAGRILRYKALEDAAKRWKAEDGADIADPARNAVGQAGSGRGPFIAVAHHRDDNAETILHHLLRGSGLRGLAGIQPVQGNRIRPLLCVGREEIRDYLQERNLRWCEDSTNGSDAYTRNRIRRELIPYMTENINRQAVENILRAGAIFGQADVYLREQARKVWEDAGSSAGTDAKGGVCAWAEIPLDVFLAQEPIIRSYLIRHMLELTAPGQKDITGRHYEMIERLARGHVGGRVDLPGGLRATRSYVNLRLERRELQKPQRQGLQQAENPRDLSDKFQAQEHRQQPQGQGVEQQPQQPKQTQQPQTQTPAPLLFPLPKMNKDTSLEIILPLPGGPAIRAGALEFRCLERDNCLQIPKKQYTKWFDYDKIKERLFIRTRRTGDFLTLPGGGRKTIRRYMIDEKVPRERRDQIPVLAEGNHVLWVVGGRISEYYKITKETHRILQVDFYEGGAYGG